MLPPRLDFTQMLQHAADDPARVEDLLQRVYAELHALASRQMEREPAGHTLQPTALVHEAWMRLAGSEGETLAWESRAHFFGAAAQAMRRILIERSRRVGREKRGGHLRRQPLEALEGIETEELDFVALDAALDNLAERDPRAADVVNLRYFAGLSMQDTARSLGISERTAAREWSVARSYLAHALGHTS